MKTLGKTSCLAKTRRYSKAVCRKVDGAVRRGDASRREPARGGLQDAARHGAARKQKQHEKEVRGSASCERDGLQKKNEPRRTGDEMISLAGCIAARVNFYYGPASPSNIIAIRVLEKYYLITFNTMLRCLPRRGYDINVRRMRWFKDQVGVFLFVVLRREILSRPSLSCILNTELYEIRGKHRINIGFKEEFSRNNNNKQDFYEFFSRQTTGYTRLDLFRM